MAMTYIPYTGLSGCALCAGSWTGAVPYTFCIASSRVPSGNGVLMQSLNEKEQTSGRGQAGRASSKMAMQPCPGKDCL